MRQGFIGLLTLLLSPAAVAECTPPLVGVGGSRLTMEVSREDRRDLEQVLGTPLDAVACSRMQTVRPIKNSFTVRHGFFVLTKDEALFVTDRKTKEVVFRTGFSSVRMMGLWVYGPGFDNTQYLSFETDAGMFRFEFACDYAGRHIVDELGRRTLVKPAVASSPGGPQYACN
jgi:hypothetical protein